MKIKDGVIYLLLLLMVGYFFYDKFIKEVPDYSFLIEENKELRKRLDNIEESYKYHDRKEAAYIHKIDTIHAKIDTTNKPSLRAMFTEFKHRTK